MKFTKIIVGIMLSIIALWLAGVWFCNSPYILIPHPELNTVGFPEKCRVTWLSEGCGTSLFGVWGVSAIQDVRSVGEPKVILWGDSYVEALQVGDDKKMAQQLTRLFAGRGTNNVAVGAGLSGQSLADYLLKIPVYEKQFSPVAAHVVIVGQIEDFFPDQNSALYAQFLSSPALHIDAAELKSPSHLKWLTYRWGSWAHADGLLSVLRDCSGGHNFRFRPGPVAKKMVRDERNPSTEDIESWFEFYARKFREATDKPLILVYLPTVPQLEENHWLFDDPDEDAARCMERVFTQQGWTVINMKERFVQYFKYTGRIPRGFANTRPGSGHLNESGHKLVAEEIFKVLP